MGRFGLMGLAGFFGLFGRFRGLLLLLTHLLTLRSVEAPYLAPMASHREGGPGLRPGPRRRGAVRAHEAE